MSKNTLFNYFTKLPGSSESPKTNGSPNSLPSKTPKRPSKENSVTPKRTPKSVNGSSKKDKMTNGSSKKDKITNDSSKKTTEKRKPKQLGNLLIPTYNIKYR